MSEVSFTPSARSALDIPAIFKEKPVLAAVVLFTYVRYAAKPEENAAAKRFIRILIHLMSRKRVSGVKIHNIREDFPVKIPIWPLRSGMIVDTAVDLFSECLLSSVCPDRDCLTRLIPL